MDDQRIFTIIDDHEDVWGTTMPARLYGGFINVENDMAPHVAVACALQWLADRQDIRICPGVLSGNYAVDVSGVLIERPTLLEALYAAVQAVKIDMNESEGNP